MRLVQSTMALTFIALVPFARFGVDFPNDLMRWYETDPPELGSTEWSTANRDVHEWEVTAGEQGVRVKLVSGTDGRSSILPFKIKPGGPTDGMIGRRTAVKVEDGWLVGFDAGEFGRALWWFSPDGKKRYKISEIQVICFFSVEKDVLAVEGLAHMSHNHGKVDRIFRGANGRWQGETFVDLGHAPQVSVRDADGSIIVVTTNRLLRIFPASKKVEVMLDRMFWGGLYPNSMAITPKGTIYVGMRRGVAKIEKKGSALGVRWLMPSKEYAEK